MSEMFGLERFNLAGHFRDIACASDAVWALASDTGSPRHYTRSSALVRFTLDGTREARVGFSESWHKVEVLPGGDLLLGSYAHLMRVGPDGEERWRVELEHGVWAAGEEACATWSEGRLSVCALETGEERGSWEVSGQVRCLAFAGEDILTGAHDGQLTLWMASGESVATRKTSSMVLAMSVHDGRVATGHGAGHVNLWTLPMIEQVPGWGGQHTFDASGPAGVRACAWSPDGARLYTLGNERLVRVWEASGEVLSRAIPKRHAQGASMALGGGLLVVGDTAGALSVWDTEEMTYETAVAPDTGATSLALTTERVALATPATIWSWGRAGDVPPTRRDVRFPPSAVSAYGDALVMVDYDRVHVLTSLEEPSEPTFRLGRYASSTCAMHGARFVTGVGKRLDVFDVARGLRLARLPHEQSVGACAFSPDGTWYVSVDTWVRAWRDERLCWATQLEGAPGWGSGVISGVAVSDAGWIAVSVDEYNNHMSSQSEILIFDPEDGALVERWAGGEMRLGQVAWVGAKRFVAPDASGVLRIGDVGVGWTGFWTPPCGAAIPMNQCTRPVAVFGEDVAFVGADANVHVTRVEAGADGAHRAPPEPAPPTALGTFEDRLAGARFLLTGRFEDTSKSFREDTLRELGATLTKTANKKVTHMVVGRPAYTQHKPAAAERKLRALIEGGLEVRVMCEEELIDMLLPTREEAQVLLREDPARWNTWRARYRTPSGGFPADLRGIDLAGATLTDAQVSGLWMDEANLSGADLAGVRINETSLRGANLEGANLAGANVWRTDFRGANLRGADLRGVDLMFAIIEGADLEGANLEGAKVP